MFMCAVAGGSQSVRSGPVRAVHRCISRLAHRWCAACFQVPLLMCTAPTIACIFEWHEAGCCVWLLPQVVANARALGEALKKLGYKLVTDGTDNHLLLWDLRGE
jgi:glycine/serine hydroxymethyltransferase